MRSPVRGAGFALSLALGLSSLPAAGSAFEWRLPAGFPVPSVPAANPMTAAKVELGRHLFYDPRLSVDGSYSCASCHRQSLAFTDGRPRALGVTGQLHPRSAMSLANVAYQPALGWDDPGTRRLEDQARVPMLNEHPVEMGLAGRGTAVLARLRADPLTARLFADAFPGVRNPFSLPRVVQALASFERTLISGASAFDRWLHGGDAGALTEGQRRGMRLFFSARLGCSGCHGGFNLSGPTVHAGSRPAAPLFHNTGLYDLDGRGAYPIDNPGLRRVTRRAADMGRFRAPTLRNIKLTAPYMHDGSVATLSEVIDLYAAGGRTSSPLKSPRLTGFRLSAGEKQDLLDFFASLTDEAFVTDPRFGAPAEPAGAVLASFPRKPDPSLRYVIYLHGRIVEEQGPKAVSPEFGPYELEAIHRALARPGIVVIGEVRPKGSEPEASARKVAGEIRKLIAAGVPGDHITVVGASKGALITMLMSTALADPEIRYVLMGNCNAWVPRNFKVDLHGEILSIFDASDDVGQSCGPLFEQSRRLGRRHEIKLETGLRHGFLYRALPAWLDPTLAWIRR